VYIQDQVETTIAVSYDGPSKTAYLFIKNPTTGLWEIKSHTFSSEINTTLGAGFTIGALVTNTSGHYLEYFKGEIGEVIIYNHSVTNANFYGENAKLLDAPSYNSMPWYWAGSVSYFSSGFSRIRNVNILNGYSADSNAVKQLYENSIGPAYVILYRDSIGAGAIAAADNAIYIDIQTLNAYDKDDNLITPVDYEQLGGTSTYPMSNAVEGTNNGGYGFWSTNGVNSGGKHGGWIKYPEMPYRIAIAMRNEAGAHPWRKPAFLKTSYVEVVGTNYTNWETKYEFIDSLGQFGTGDDLPADFGIMAHNLIGIGGSNSDTHCSIDSWGLTGDGTIILYNRTYDTHGRFCKIYLAGDTVTGAARYRTHDTPIYNSLTELVNGYNTSSGLQNYVYFTKGADFGSILFDNPSSYDIILEGFRFSYKGLLQTAVDAWCSDRLSAENIYGHISDWNTRDITDMSNLFDNKNTFNDDISRWDVSNVTTMTAMFGNCTVFNQPLNSWDVSNVESFRWMFYNCSDFNQPLNNWDTSSLIDIGYMFRGATSFNQNISNWNVSNVLHSELPWHEGCPIDNENKPAGL
jgi:surface protein